MRTRVLAALDDGRLDDARAALEGWAGDDSLLHRLWLWLVVRPRGPGHAAAALREAPRAVEHDAPEVACLDACLRASEALQRGEPGALLAEALAAAERLPPEATFTALVAASVLQAAYRFTGDPTALRRTMDVCLRLGDRSDVPALAVQGRALAGNLRMLQGRLHEADALFAGALELARHAGGTDGPDAAMAHQFRGYVLYEWNRLDEARARLLEAVRAGERSGSVGVLSGSYRMLSVLELAARRRDRAAEWMARLEALMGARPLSERNREWLAATRAGVAVATGDLRAVDGWVRRRGYRVPELVAAGPGGLLASLHEVTLLLDGLLALGRTREVRELAVATREAAASGGRAWFAARAGAMEAAALDAEGHADEADAALARAFESGRDEGFVRVWADVGAPLLPVLERAAALDPASGWLGRVLAATHETAGRRRPRPDLTDREREVLGLLARGLTNLEIAERLGLSVATVKTHLHHLYGKLHVGSRTRAVSRAEALSLL